MERSQALKAEANMCACGPLPSLQVHLNMFQFFMFWAAFYVLRTSSSCDRCGCQHLQGSRAKLIPAEHLCPPPPTPPPAGPPEHVSVLHVLGGVLRAAHLITQTERRRVSGWGQSDTGSTAIATLRCGVVWCVMSGQHAVCLKHSKSLRAAANSTASPASTIPPLCVHPWHPSGASDAHAMSA
jgi:hypothetical protein